jgi:glutathione S-transferase
MPTLYSFRRCPYAIRARLALDIAGTEVHLIEVDLKDKPPAMLALSPKGTVPVLQLADGTVLDESLDIMLWALELDPGALPEQVALIAESDGDFKHHLDRTKYADHHPGADPEQHRSACMDFLATLEARLANHSHLFGDAPGLADWALLPFVRQFSFIDRPRFDAEAPPHLLAWLNEGLASPRFVRVMAKHQEGAP